MLEPGTKAPAFELRGDDGAMHSLAAFLDDGPLVLYFYPADFTPGCTREACELRDLHGELDAAGLTVVGVSPQDEASHVRFREKYGLPFRLLCDEDKQVAAAYGATGALGRIKRVTYLIDSSGTIEDAVAADFRIARHTAFVQKAARAAGGQ